MMPRFALRSRLLSLIVLVALATCMAGCVCNVSTSDPVFKETRELTVEHRPASALRIETGNGAIEVRRSEKPDVMIKAVLQSPDQDRLSQASVITDRRANGELSVFVKWPEGKRRSNEGCSFEVEIPDVASSFLHTDNGAVRLTGLSGPADVRTHNGAVTVADHKGPVDAETTNGEVRIERVAGKVDARTSNGAVTVRLTDDNAGPVQARTSNGIVTLEAGKGFAGEVDMSTSNGLVSHHGTGKAQVLSAGRQSMRIRIGDANQVSTLRTSNGMVTLRVP